MIKTYCYLFLCSWLALPALPEPPLEPGAPLPKADVKLHDFSGKEITLNSARRSNGLLVMFSGNSCPYVIRNQSRTQYICRLALKNDIGVVLINSNTALHNDRESPDAMKIYANDQQYDWYYVTDKKAALADAFDAAHTPECYLFDKNARLAYKGAIDDSPGNESAVKMQYLQNAMTDMLTGKSLKVNSTATVGCNIKRF